MKMIINYLSKLAVSLQNKYKSKRIFFSKKKNQNKQTYRREVSLSGVKNTSEAIGVICTNAWYLNTTIMFFFLKKKKTNDLGIL